MAALLVAGCGDSVGPVAGGRDLEFSVPIAPIERATIQQRLVESPYAELPAIATPDVEWWNLFYLADWFVKGWFSGSTYTFEYGLRGYGTGYSMLPKLFITDADGRTIVNQAMLGRSEDIGLPFPMRPTAQESLGIGMSCGATASVGVTFIVRFAAPYLATLPILQISRIASDIAYQTTCPPPSPSPGTVPGGDPDDPDAVYLCWYEVWYNQQGQVVQYNELSCSKLGGNEF